MVKSSILDGAIMAFTRSLGETGATQAVVANAQTAPVYIVDLINLETAAGYYSAGLACIMLIVISFLFMLALRYVTNRRAR